MIRVCVCVCIYSIHTQRGCIYEVMSRRNDRECYQTGCGLIHTHTHTHKHTVRRFIPENRIPIWLYYMQDAHNAKY